MKLTVNKDEFLRDLGIADSIINTRSPLAMLLNVYIEADENGTITILSYNGENGVKVETTGVVDEAGKITLLSKKLLEVMRKIPGERVVLKNKPDSEHEILIHPDNKENPFFSLNGVSGDAYPIFNEFRWDNYIKIAQETMKTQIVSTEFAVSTDSSKPAFTGTYIEEAVEGQLSFVTSDGKRLSVITRPYEEKKGDVSLGVIVPERIFKTLQSILSTGELLFSVHNNQAFFKIANVYLFSNLVEGKFPNYKDVIPGDRVNIANLDSASFLQAIETVSVMSDPDSGKTRMEINGSSMIIISTHQIYGIARQEIEISYNGAAITIAFNNRAVADFLRVAQGRKIEFVINSQSSPLLLKTVDDDHFIYITMPLKLYD